MSITFSNEYKSKDPIVEYDSRDANDIPFHRHCQATICSAYGTATQNGTGNGRSWHILNDLNLSYLPEGWKNQFIGKTSNITQDFAAILNIINSVAQQRQSSLSMTVQSGDKNIPVTISQGGTMTFGRKVQLTIDGKTISFNTLVSDSSDVLSVTSTKKSLKFMYNGDQLDSVELPMPSDKEIDLSSIRSSGGSSSGVTGSYGNYLPESSMVGMPIIPEEGVPVYRISTDGNVVPEIDLSNYNDNQTGIVKFFVIVENTGEHAISVEAPITVQDGVFSSPMLQDGTVNPGMIGMYTVIVDMKERIISIEKDAEYVSDPSNMTMFTFTDGSTRAVYLVGEINKLKFQDVGLLDSNLNWIKSPTEVKIGKPVTQIGDNAFSGCSDLEMVGRNMATRDVDNDYTIPETITRIGQFAFSGCSDLHKIFVPKTVQSIGRSAFSGCSSLVEMELPFAGISRSFEDDGQAATREPYLFGAIFGQSEYTGSYAAAQYTTSSSTTTYYIPSSLQEITITDQKNICYGAFSNCNKLKRATIEYQGSSASDKMTSIKGIFYGCTQLQEISIPTTITEIGEYTFGGCTNLVGCIESPNVIHDGVQTIGKYAFQQCSSITYMHIPSTVTRIEDYAFTGCTGFTEVVVPDSVTHLGFGCFQYCTGLQQMTLPFIGESRGVDMGQTGNVGTTVLGYVFGTSNEVSGLTPVAQMWGSSATNTTTYYIPSSLKKVVVNNRQSSIITTGAFYGCTMLEQIVIPSTAYRIGARAFYGCQSITRLEIPDGVTDFSAGALAGIVNLQYLKIPFAGTSRTATNYNTLFGIMFQEYSSGTIPTGFVKTPQAYTGSSAKYYLIPQALTQVVITGNLLNYGVFQNCSMIEDITLSGNPTTIPERAFKNIPKISEISIPDSVTSIGSEAFMNCENLTSLKLGSNVTSIGANAFSRTTSAFEMSVYVDSLDQWLGIQYGGSDESYPFSANAFNRCQAQDPDSSNYLYVKNGTTNAYELVEDITVTDSVPPGAFCGCRHVKSVEFVLQSSTPTGIDIGNYAFYKCDALKGGSADEGPGGNRILWLPGNNFNIGYAAFQGCKSLTSAMIGSMEDPSTIPTPNIIIRQYAFAGCYDSTNGTGLNEVVIFNTKVIGNFSFNGCGNLKKLQLTNIASDIITRSDNTKLPSGASQESAFLNCPIEELQLNDNCFLTATANYTVASIFGNNIKTLDIGESVTSIAIGALKGLTNLETLNIPFTGTSRTATGKNALVGIVFGTVSSGGVIMDYWVGSGGTSGNTSQVRVSLPTTLKHVTLTASDSARYAIPNCAFYFYDANYYGPETITLQGNIVEIGQYAFSGCKNITSIGIPATVETIGNQAFNFCENLAQVNFSGNALTTIGNSAFYGCRHLGSISLPESTVNIGDEAFGECENLAIISFPGVTDPATVGDGVFAMCDRLEDLYFRGLNLAQLTLTGGVVARWRIPQNVVKVYCKDGADYL